MSTLGMSKTDAAKEIALPFPFITGAYVNTWIEFSCNTFYYRYHSLLSRVLMSTRLLHGHCNILFFVCYHSLLSRVLMSTRKTPQDHEKSGRGLPFPFITGAYVNLNLSITHLSTFLPCYHSLLSRVLMSTRSAQELLQLSKHLSYHSLLSRVLMSTDVIATLVKFSPV
ncbi:hypothetical protein B0H22_10926 [Methanohalophilus euhalobius]|uniref:Uncharacterized protein n=1 Tax=Methanohalophilus euhalobius TaxID=51203 RepID=A0A314ZQQ5_9EURY|nr:hypothetical protein B0H22_10926 [Methanohalophilus euhalobius]